MTETSQPTDQEVTQTAGHVGETVTRTDANLLAAMPTERRFAQFELLEILGTGGMGIVWKARDTQLNRFVALKVLLAGAAAHPDQTQRFKIEAEAIARLEHPHIVPVLQFDTHNGQPFFTMPLMTGGKLADIKETFRNNSRGAAQLVEKLARAVAYAHEKRVLHRDLKPGNILFDADGEPRIADFGLAKLLDIQGELTITGAVIGTPAYMSPEQAAGKQAEVGPGADIWALGIILFELVSGARPFPGTSREELTPRILNDDCRKQKAWPAIEVTGVGGIILKCLQKNPTDRYLSASALADDLANFLAGLPTIGRIPRERRVSRRTLMLVSAGAAGAFLLGGTALIRRALQPSDELSKMQRELEETGTVNLLDAKGMPRWHQFVYGEPSIGALAGQLRQLEVLAPTFAVIELLPSNNSGNLSFEAEFRFEPLTNAPGVVAIYLGRGRYQAGSEMVDCLLRYRVQEHPEAIEGMQRASRELEVLWLNADGAAGSTSLQGPSSFEYPSVEPYWYKLKLQLGPAAVHHQFGDQQSIHLPRQLLTTFVAKGTPTKTGDLSAVTPTLQANEGLGVSLSRSRAWFRKLQLSVAKTKQA